MLQAILVSCAWLASLGMVIFDIDHFPFTPLMAINVGLVAYLANPEMARKEISFKEFFRALLILIAFVGGAVLLFNKFPVLAQQPPQPYRSIVYAAVILSCTAYIWKRWYIANKKKS